MCSSGQHVCRTNRVLLHASSNQQQSLVELRRETSDHCVVGLGYGARNIMLLTTSRIICHQFLQVSQIDDTLQAYQQMELHGCDTSR